MRLLCLWLLFFYSFLRKNRSFLLKEGCESMELLTWCCYYFAAIVVFNVCLNAVAAATDLVKIKIVGKI